MHRTTFVLVLLAAPSFVDGAPPAVITTRGEWTSLIREFGVESIESPESDAKAFDGSDSARDMRNARVFFYDPRRTLPADQLRRERLAAQGTLVVELRDPLRSSERLRRQAVAVRIHAALVRAMPERKLDLDARLGVVLRRCVADSPALGRVLAESAAIGDGPAGEGRTDTGRTEIGAAKAGRASEGAE